MQKHVITKAYYFSIRLIIKICNKEPAELYDYEGHNGNRTKTATKSDGYIIRTGNGIQYTSSIPSIRSNGLSTLAYIDCDPNDFIYCSKFENKNVNEQSWINLKTLKNSHNESV